MTAKDLVLAAQSAALMAICSWISVPAAVPFTLQTFGVFLSAGLIGGKRGTAAVAVYLLLGSAGLPVFAGFTGGMGHITGPTGGYLVGFLFTALVMWLAEHFFGRSMHVLVLSMVAGLAVCYAFGTAWFVISGANVSGGKEIMSALSLCVLPYIIPDAIKIALAAQLTRRLRPYTADHVKDTARSEEL